MVANLVLLVPGVCVGAVGLPDNAGDASAALSAKSATRLVTPAWGIPVKLVGAAASVNGQPPASFDLASLGLSDVELGHFEDAAKASKNRNELLAALTRVPGAMTPAVMAALSDEATGEAMRVALGGTF